MPIEIVAVILMLCVTMAVVAAADLGRRSGLKDAARKADERVERAIRDTRDHVRGQHYDELIRQGNKARTEQDRAVDRATRSATAEENERLGELLWAFGVGHLGWRSGAVWLAGRDAVGDDPWEFMGVFGSEAEAVALCSTEDHFVARVALNEALPDDGSDFAFSYRPLAEPRPDDPE